jgi:hypothetical protein
MDSSIRGERRDQEKQKKRVELQAPRIYLFGKMTKIGKKNKKVKKKVDL